MGNSDDKKPYAGPARMEPVPHRDPHSGETRLQSHRVGSNKSAGGGTVNRVGQHEQLLGLAATGDPGGPQTPVEVDTAISELYTQRAQAGTAVHGAEEILHRMAGDHPHPVGTRSRPVYKWGMTFDEVLERGPRHTYDEKTWDQKLQQREDGLARITELDSEMGELEQKYVDAGGWPRFFLVTNPGGHIHSSMHCSTCNAETKFAWLPELSGQTEGEAVENYGGILCSICYPSAPTEWTEGESHANREAREQREREKQERLTAKLAKALMPDGEPLRLPDTRDILKTQRAAEIWLSDSYDDIYGKNAERHANDRELVLDALKDKTGKSRDELLAETMKRVQARRKREGRA